ncbi:asparaginase [Pseudomonas entomophila]|uniref:asparaginase n=1 Tax=Pseudomonas entomophila TaxID=312306 RepID=UPI0015E320EB|nr:asparaginase [Pseudomonas entomophila]MBA1191094.1 asparaginase [Pseudomonas entomophila]
MTARNRLPTLSIGSLGGTICMASTSGRAGVTPRLGAGELLAELPGLTQMACLHSADLCLLPSASMGFADLIGTFDWAKAQVESGACGVVLTQGTDTLEETAYWLDLLWPFAAPLVLTGAMCPAGQAGSDGPGNLLAAAQVALSADSRGRGALVVMNGEIHAAHRVRKTASLALAAFESPDSGPLGCLREGRADYRQPPVPRITLPIARQACPRVALLEATLGADTMLLEALPDLGYRGLVIAGFGAGHVSAEWARVLERLATRMPVVVASRTGKGPTAQATYGFDGGEIDLQAKGVQMAGSLCPRKSRLLLSLLLANGMASSFARFLPR